ncbi:unnamed protein product [Zymoseptoria tritici ST99CH_3D7]|uniref:F-box domain-containing protein n=1 Tax=Zymoseptoria tritici (strain ST99CH_3D7) TaxID=1276538 RepID=A0A1X7RSH5_ZYMT9|nr:unnamed protein product [Zymoseptoria tritici ST99CH_3D7]
MCAKPALPFMRHSHTGDEPSSSRSPSQATENMTPSSEQRQSGKFRASPHLPLEILFIIGKMVLDDLPPMKLVKNEVVTRAGVARRRRRRRDYKFIKTHKLEEGTELPAVLQVCHALRDELSPRYYRETVARIEISDSAKDRRRFGRWLLAIGPDARRKLRNDCGSDVIRVPWL